MERFETPILIILFNRPDLTYRLLQSLDKIKPAIVYVSVDGPRLGNSDDLNSINKILNLLNEYGNKMNFKLKINNYNLGCKISVSQAIDWFLSEIEEGIILEDDCIPNPDFFQFCKYHLHDQRKEKHILSISGSRLINFPIVKMNNLYSKYPSIWGWATWRDRWNLFDVELKDWDKDYLPEWFLKYQFTNENVRSYWYNKFNSIKYENFDTWDYQLVYLSLKFNMLNIHPKYNLIKNLGFGKMATHTTFPRIINISVPKKSKVSFHKPVIEKKYDNYWELKNLLIDHISKHIKKYL